MAGTNEHWHCAQVEGNGSTVLPEIYPDWGSAVQAMRRRQVPGGPILTVRPCRNRCAGLKAV